MINHFYKRLVNFFLILSVASFTLYGQTNYYSKAGGNLNVTTNWGTNTDGSGTTPGNFTNNNQIFNIRNRASHTINYSWTVSGTGSKVVVGDGTNPCVITLTSAPTWSATDISNAGKIVDQVRGAFGTFNVFNGAEYQFARDGGVTLPVATWGATSTLNVTGVQANALTTFTSTGNTFGNIIWNCATQTNPGSQPLMVVNGASMSVKGDFSILNTNAGSLRVTNVAGINVTLTVEGNLTVGNGVNTADFYTASGNGASSTINIGGDLIVLINSTFRQQGNATTIVDFGIAGKAPTSVWGGPGSYTNTNITYNILNTPAGKKITLSAGQSIPASLTVNSGAVLDVVTYLITGTGSFVLNSGASLITANLSGIDASLSSGSIQTTTRTFSNGADYTYNSSTGNQITGTGLPATVNSLTISNTASGGIVTLTNGVTVSTSLILNSGVLFLGANNITLPSGATLGGNLPGSANMVATGTGSFIKHFPAGDSPAFTFPVGDITGSIDYSPFTIDFASNATAGTLGINVINAKHPSMDVGATASDYLTRYWTFSGAGLTSYNYGTSTYAYPSADISGTETLMKLSYWNGSAWTSIASSSAGGNLLTISSALDESTGPLFGNSYTGRFTGCTGDIINPVVTCTGNITQNNIAGTCTATIAVPDAVYSDNCAVSNLTWTMTGATTAFSPATGINQIGTYTFNGGVTTITFTAYDAAGNTASCNFTVTVNDAEVPVVTCPGNYSQNNDAGTCTASVVTANPVMSDNCSVTTLTWSMTGATTAVSPGAGINNVGTYSFNLGVTTVTYTAKDAANNSAVCSFTVTVTDNELPSITCPADVPSAKISDNGTGDCTTTVAIGTPVTADNCSVASVVARIGAVVINPVTYLFPIGTWTVTWTVTDGSGNTASCNQLVTVTDDESPVVVCKDITIYLDALGNATLTPAEVDNGSFDPCSGISFRSVSPNTFNTSNIGSNPVTLYAEDGEGNSSTCNATVTVLGTLPPTAYYSYQTGYWDIASTWTSDPGGTTGPGTTVPGPNDKVVILSGRTVYLQSDVTSTNLDVTINSGGILDQTTFQFTQPLAALKGGGIHKLASSNYPSATVNTFVTSDGGTTEYNHNGDMSASQATYYHLVIRSAGTVTQVSDITLNGNLDVKQGTLRINDATSRRLKLIINGNVTVDNLASVAVGTGVTNTITTPLTAPAGQTGGFVNYYETQSHRIQIFGNFTNNGTVRFTNLSSPVYNAFPPTAPGATTGFATVYFQGGSDNTVTASGQTDFYNLIIDKGSDQTYKLTVISSAYGNFRLFGANIAEGENAAPATSADPFLKKALWIKTGTLVLQGLVVIPSLTEGNTGGAIPSHFFIPAKGALVLDGGGVIVMSTANSAQEVDGAYGVAGTAGVLGTGGQTGLAILGKLQINSGYLSTRESTGILYYTYAPGQFILNGGTADAKQFHSAGANSLISYSQTGGLLELRGRFQRTTSTFTPAGLVSGALNTARVVNGINAAQGTLNIIQSGGSNSFAMSGGTIRIHDVCNNVASHAFEVLCSVSAVNVTGGTVEILPRTGTVLADADYQLNSTAPLYNLIINRASSISTVILNVNPLVVTKDLTLTSGDLVANNLNVTVGGNFSISSGTTYVPGTNTTIFNGTGNQVLNVDLAVPNAFNNLTIDKPVSTVLTIAGSQSVINTTGNFRLVSAILNSDSKTLNIAGNVYNSGIQTGSGNVVLNGTNLQSIDGNGVFRNLDLLNTNAATAPVSLAANLTIKGILNLANDKLFSIGINNLKLDSAASVANYSAIRYIQTSGNSGDGGLTKVYTSSAPFIFPVGAPTITPSNPVKYTPASLGFSSDPATFGSVTVIPVGYEHPLTTINNLSLTYYWKVRSSGFTGYASKVLHQFIYDDSDIAGTETNYVPALLNILTSQWNYGQTSDIITLDNEINDWSSPGSSADFIDADYTAGDVSAFGLPQTYYSRQSGLWSNTNTWSITGHGGAPAGTVPGANDIVIIGNGHTVNLYNDVNYPLNTATVSCASLQIATGSTLDIGNNPGSVFSMVKSHPSGNGTFRITTNKAADVPSTARVSLFAFPQNSDFSDFNVNLGTTEFYTTTNIGNSLYILPPISYVGNMVLSPFGDATSGDNMTLQNVSTLTVYGDLSTNGTTAFSAIGLSWNTNNAFYGNLPTYTTIEKTVTVKGNLNINGGSFTYYDDVAPQHLIVEGNINIAATNGACILVWDSNYGFTPFQNGPAVSNTLEVGGNIVNNGVTHATYPVFAGLNLFRNDGSPHYVDLTFFGSSNATVSGTGNINVRMVTVNKGTSDATTLDLLNGGTMTTLTNNWLTLQNGTLRYLRTNPNTDFSISTTTPFTIPATAGLTINLPSNTGNRNILIGNVNNNNGDLILSGKLTIINGRVFIGRTGGTDNNNNDIEYTSSGAASIDIQGGLLQVNGQVRRNPFNAGAMLKYSQTGGIVTINGQAANTTNGKLEVLNSGSDFSMTGGTLNIVRGNGPTKTPSTPFGDVYLRPETGSVTGGTIVFSQGASTVQNYFLDANIPLNHLTITGNASPDSAVVRLLVSPLTLNGDMTINANSALYSNNINITFNGNLINNTGSADGYKYGTNNTTFSATNGSSYAGAQTITGIVDFYDLTVSPGTSLTLTNPTNVNRDLNIASGNFVLGANAVNLKRNLTNNGSYIDNNLAGNGITLNGTVLQTISGTGAYARLTLDNSAGAQILNDITLQEDLTLTTGILDIKKYLLTLGTGSLIQGAPFSAAKMITSDGVFSNVGLKKFFNIGGTSFLYPIGTSGKYTPVQMTSTASSSVGSIRINNINSMHPSVKNPATAQALDYYFEVQSSGITGFTGDLVFNYYQEDVVGNESLYKAAKIEVPGTIWSLTDGVDAPNNTITETYSLSNNLSGEYTAGIMAAFFTDVPEFTSTADGNWTDETKWVQTAGDPVTLTPGVGPNGFIAIIKHVITLNTDYCEGYRTEIDGTLKVVSPFYGHNLGTVTGNGKLYLESGSFPAGVFTTFLACSNNATIEYGGSGTYTIIADLYDNISNVIFSGSGTRVLPNKDLTVCNLLRIDGPVLDNSVFNRKLTIQGTMTLISGSFNSGSGAGATVSFAGSGLQSVGDDIDDYFRGSNAFNNLEINNSAGLRIGDDGAIEVKGSLLLTNGLINTSASRKLTIINPAINCVTPAGGSANSFVDGPLIKRISQYDNFLFPIGKSGTPNTLGNNIRISSTQAGPLLWSAEYFTPNTTSGAAFVTIPLIGVSSQEFYTVKTTTGSQATLNLNWTSNSDVTPVITGGISNIRLARFDTGTGKWVEVPTSSSGGDSFGTATSTSYVTTSTTGSDDYTLGSITDLKPRAKFNPSGPVCGTAGIPVIFTAPYTIPFNYRLNYTIDGVAQAPEIISSIPVGGYILPTPVPGVYKLTDFTYDMPATNKAGVVDAGTVTVYPVPTTSEAGGIQTLCGVTSTNLSGNTPAVGTGVWSILAGAGGTLITPTSPTSQFIGLNGVSYTLRWTISSGTCTSVDDVVINFTILPAAPAAASPQSFCGPQVITAVIPLAVPPSGSSIDWYSAASGGVLLPLGTSLTNGTTYYAESNAGTGCKSLTRTSVTVNLSVVPVAPTLSSASPGIGSIVCTGYNTGSATFAAGSGEGTDELQYSVDGGSTWLAYVNSSTISTAGASVSVQVRGRRTGGVCPPSAYNTYTIWTIGTAPVAPALSSANPAVASTVCADYNTGFVIGTAGSGGSSGASDEYRLSLDGGSTWAAYTSGSSIVTSSATGTIIVQSRRTAGSYGCSDTPWTTISTWTLGTATVAPVLNVATPVSGTSICAGYNGPSATITAGSGGSTGAADTYEYSINNGGAWLPYASGTTIDATGATGNVLIRVSRSGGSYGCTGVGPTAIVTWLVASLPVAPVLSSAVPASGSTVCEGFNTGTVAGTAGSGGSAGAADEYQFSIDGGSIYNPYVSGTPIITTGATGNIIVQSRRTGGTYGCSSTAWGTISTWNLGSPTVNPALNTATPVSGTVICAGYNGPSATITTGSGGSTGTTDVYEYSLDNGSTWMAYVSGSTINTLAATGNVLIRVSRTGGSYGCSNTGPVTIVSWTIGTSPVAPTLSSATPADGSTICAGFNTGTVTGAAGSGGSTGAADEYQLSINGGGSWVAYTSGNAITTTGATTSVIVQARRTGGSYGCSNSAWSTISTWTVNPVVAASVSIAADVNPVCAGTNVTFTATPINGGATPSYQWYNGAIAVGTNSDTYSSNALANGDVIKVVMTSSLTCVSGSLATSNLVTMTVNPVLPASVSITADATTICAGTTVNFTATPDNGGTPTYQWYNGVTPVGTNSATFSSNTLANGDVISVVMTSDLTCVSGSPATSNLVTMIVNPVLLASVSITADATTICAGTTVNFTATPVNGGTPTYQWYNGVTLVGTNSATFSSNTLANGDVISVVMTSSLTCVSGSPATSNLVTMTVNPVLPASVSIAADGTTVCSGTTVNFTATPVNGGTPTYQWYNGVTPVGTNSATYSSNTLANADNITVVMTSGLTCVSGSPATSNIVAMTVNPVLPVSVSISEDANPVCAGTTVNFAATPTNGGLTPSYQWQVNGINAGSNQPTYSYVPVNGDIVTVILTSSETCQSGGPATSNSLTMVVSTAPVVTSSQVNVLCKAASTGSIDITVTGGTAPYTYAWTGNGVTAASEDQSGLTAGSYSVIVTDAASCNSTSYSFTITEPAIALSGSITSQTNVLVFGGNNGSVTVAGSGGTGAYQYKLDAGSYQASGTFSTLIAGNYIVTVQDANLCTFDVTVTITQPSAPLSASIASQTNVQCFGTATGSVTAAGSGGSTPYEYSLNGGAYQTSATFTALTAGSYTITVRDAASITATTGVTLTQPASALGGYLVSHTDVLCFGTNSGILTVSGLSGTAPYLYKLGSGSFQASGTFTNLAAGTYTVTVQDANLCTFDVTADITQPSASLAGTILVQTNVSCHGGVNGSVAVAGSGGTAPYEYNISGGTFQTSGIFSGLAAGNYTIVVRDASLCTSNVSVTVTEPEVLALDHTTVSASCPNTPDGSISLIITGGTQPYNAIWSDGLTGISRTNIPDGSYSVVVTDISGCAASLVIELDNTGSADCIVVQEIITPNNDGFNDTWKIRNIELFPDAEVLVYSRWGKLVFKTKNISDNEWDGTLDGKLLPTDSYHYILHLNDGSKPRSGVVSIIR